MKTFFYTLVLVFVLSTISASPARDEITALVFKSSPESIVGRGAGDELDSDCTISADLFCYPDRPVHAITLLLEQTGSNAKYPWLSFSFATPREKPFEIGKVYRASRYPFQGETEAGLDFSGVFSGEERSNNQASGWFKVLELKMSGDTLTSLAVDWCQHDEKDKKMWNRGRIRINSSIPLFTPVPIDPPSE